LIFEHLNAIFRCVIFIDFMYAQGVKSAQQLLSSLGRLLRCSPAQEVILGLSLLHSTNPDVKSQALALLRQKFPEFVRTLIEAGTKSKYFFLYIISEK